MATIAVNKSGVHLTGADSGWPVATASDTAEPEPKKDGTGADPLAAGGSAVSYAAGAFTDDAA
jgi:hypothetical protein